MLPPRTGAVGGVRHGRGSDEISARASGGGSPEFRSRRSDGGDGKSGESGRAAGGVVGFFGRRSTRMARGKNNDDGAKDDEDGRRRGPTEEEGAGGDAGGGGCSGGAITIRPWSFRGRRSRPCRPRGCTSRPRVFLRVRIRSLVDSGDDAGADRPGGGEEDDEYDNDVSYLVNEGARRCTSAPRWRTPHPPP